jgi:PleD family two-component response regulator
LFLGLESSLCTDLGRSLAGHEVLILRNVPEQPREIERYLEQTRPDVLFCPSEESVLSRVLRAARTAGVPAIVVSRLPHAHEWLDAIEAGASDYVAPPFEERQIEWLMSTHRRAIAIGA